MPRSRLPILQTGAASGCAACAYASFCGGMDGIDALTGCGELESCCGTPDGCDWVCPNNPDWFVKAWNDVRVPTQAEREGNVDLVGVDAARFPEYVPVIAHGGKRRKRLARPMVAVPLSRIIRLDRRDPIHRPPRLVAQTASKLRRYLRIANDTEIIVLGIAKDAYLETFWHWHEDRKFATDLSRIGVRGVSLPNFSAFFDAPPPHTRRNYWRAIRIGQQLSKAGVPVIYHVNAISEKDVEFHVTMLKANSSIQVLCREFQTGNASENKAVASLNLLLEIEERVGRTFHHLLVGAAFIADCAKGLFPSRYTIVEQRPFINTVKRHKFYIENGRCRTAPNPSRKEEMLDGRLVQEITTRVDYLECQPPRLRRRPRQLLLRVNNPPTNSAEGASFRIVDAEQSNKGRGPSSEP